MPKERIQPPGLSRPPTYTHVVKAGDTVYIAGQGLLPNSGELPAGPRGW